MRATRMCKKCDSTTLWVIDNVQQTDPSNDVGVQPMFVAVIRTATLDRVEVGTFETWICAQCGYTEWYAKDFRARRLNDTLATLAQTPGSGVRVVASHAGRGPFR